MRDALGIYYYPDPTNKKLRVYVRKSTSGKIEFRLWHDEHPEVWQKHLWLDYDVLIAGANLYKKERDGKSDVLKLYDLSIATSLLNEAHTQS